MTIKIGIINETDENERRVTADSNFGQPLSLRAAIQSGNRFTTASIPNHPAR